MAGSVQNDKRGFTLVELTVSMAILAGLVALGLFAVNATRVQSRNTARRSNMTSFKVALESYHGTHRSYPDCGAPVSIYEFDASCLAQTPPTAGEFLANGFADPVSASWNPNSCYRWESNNTFLLRIRPETPYGPDSNPETDCSGLANYPERFDQL